jgi:hypothetical protein
MSSDFERLMQVDRRGAAVTPELQRLMRIAGLLLLSPAALWIARAFVHSAIQDRFGQGYDGPLALWTLLVALIACWQLSARPANLMGVRQVALLLLAVVTIAGAAAYGYGALTSHANAVASAPERTFAIYRCHGRCRMGGYFVHQRADGTTLEGEHVGAPLAYGITCTEVQRLTGAYGFTWVRVLGRSRPPEHQVMWPIRRQDCFSNQPLDSLKR